MSSNGERVARFFRRNAGDGHDPQESFAERHMSPLNERLEEQGEVHEQSGEWRRRFYEEEEDDLYTGDPIYPQVGGGGAVEDQGLGQEMVMSGALAGDELNQGVSGGSDTQQGVGSTLESPLVPPQSPLAAPSSQQNDTDPQNVTEEYPQSTSGAVATGLQPSPPSNPNALDMRINFRQRSATARQNLRRAESQNDNWEAAPDELIQDPPAQTADSSPSVLAPVPPAAPAEHNPFTNRLGPPVFSNLGPGLEGFNAQNILGRAGDTTREEQATTSQPPPTPVGPPPPAEYNPFTDRLGPPVFSKLGAGLESFNAQNILGKAGATNATGQAATSQPPPIPVAPAAADKHSPFKARLDTPALNIPDTGLKGNKFSWMGMTRAANTKQPQATPTKGGDLSQNRTNDHDNDSSEEEDNDNSGDYVPPGGERANRQPSEAAAGSPGHANAGSPRALQRGVENPPPSTPSEGSNNFPERENNNNSGNDIPLGAEEANAGTTQALQVPSSGPWAYRDAARGAAHDSSDHSDSSDSDEGDGDDSGNYVPPDEEDASGRPSSDRDAAPRVVSRQNSPKLPKKESPEPVGGDDDDKVWIVISSDSDLSDCSSEDGDFEDRPHVSRPNSMGLTPPITPQRNGGSRETVPETPPGANGPAANGRAPGLEPRRSFLTPPDTPARGNRRPRDPEPGTPSPVNHPSTIADEDQGDSESPSSASILPGNSRPRKRRRGSDAGIYLPDTPIHTNGAVRPVSGDLRNDLATRMTPARDVRVTGPAFVDSHSGMNLGLRSDEDEETEPDSPRAVLIRGVANLAPEPRTLWRRRMHTPEAPEQHARRRRESLLRNPPRRRAPAQNNRDRPRRQVPTRTDPTHLADPFRTVIRDHIEEMGRRGPLPQGLEPVEECPLPGQWDPDWNDEDGEDGRAVRGSDGARGTQTAGQKRRGSFTNCSPAKKAKTSSGATQNTFQVRFVKPLPRSRASILSGRGRFSSMLPRDTTPAQRSAPLREPETIPETLRVLSRQVAREAKRVVVGHGLFPLSAAACVTMGFLAGVAQRSRGDEVHWYVPHGEARIWQAGC